MENPNETFEEALADERDHIERAKADSEDLEIECVFTDEEVVAIIDRLESAHKRGVAELRGLLNNVAKACDAEEAKLPVGGNIDTRLWLEGIIGRIRKAGEK